ncbi:RagB/SusD family nutrient uptake outer membrane protein [Olivibacter sitiensis]|uniref:RagB/SusD family nutrient uptake outer membrane protein n=1 Tax=Olivibacter sitiensis TaxID=376470 RepID=UPI000405E9A8|nr:RagB/SusD family nutrient uptake outer membrane protein [Olivibacter sitiensis]
MYRIFLNISICFIVLLVSCSDDFLNVDPRSSVTDDAVWSSGAGTKQFINDVYQQTLDGPLYRYTAIDNYQFDYMFTDDGAINNTGWNEFSFTASNVHAQIRRWNPCYTNIRKANLGIERLSESTVISEAEKERYLGDLYFLRGLLYFELFRFYGGVPIITKPLDRNEDEIAYSRNTEKEVLDFIVSDFQTAADKLPLTVVNEEYGRATKGAAIGMKAVAYLHGAGTVDASYYAAAAETANILINGDLAGRYGLFGKDETTIERKREAFINLFLEPYEGNAEVIFDVQYAYPYRTQGGYQTIAAPGVPGPGHAYGWGFSAPSQNLVDAFEMQDGSKFDWNNPAQASNPYANRDQRLYGTILYHGVNWKGAPLSLSSNRFDNGIEVTNNLPNGLFSTKSEATKTGYYIRKHQNEPVICGPDNRSGIGDGGNVIVLRYAEILLTYAEAQNEATGPDASVHDAVNQIRRRAGQPDLPTGLGQTEMRQRIRNERRVELAFESKRFFDIVRWRAGEEYLNQPIRGMNAKYVRNASTGEISITYTPFNVFNKRFNAPKNYLLPIPQSAINRNPNLVQNPDW